MKPILTKRLIAVCLLTLLAVLPILAVLRALFFGEFENWQQLWQTTLPDYLINTSLLMILVGGLSGLIGTYTAWCVTAYDFKGRKTLSWMLILPLSAPAYIIAYLYTDLMEFYGPVQSGLRTLFGWQAGSYWFPNIRNVPGAAIMLSLVLYPYVYLLARAAFTNQSQGQWHAARSLGLTPRQAFWRVALPAARPAIAGGLALVLMETLADFGVADFFAIPTFSTGIFRNWLALGNKDIAMKLASLMLLAVFALLIIESLSRKGRVATHDARAVESELIKVSKAKAAMISALCFLPVIFGFLTPFCVLAYYALIQGDGQGGAQFIQYTLNSLSTAIVVAMIAVIIAIFFAYMYRENESGFLRANIRLATLGYALPGALLVVGLLAPLGTFDQMISKFSRDTLGWSNSLLLTGTTIALIYALTIRFLTVSFNSVNTGFEKVPLSMDHAARSLGAKPIHLIRNIHIPLLRSSVLGGAMLVFIDVLRELPATLILRPFNFETLATRVYWLANDERLREASTAALTIILVGVLPVLVLNLFFVRKRSS
ncbi:ABC transporter permease [Hellea balneolensis]|uniref:ABC transporter permease n=1 Tax=Hellea balneolensis TaxID=287478 RepID=UPI000411BACD|nr:iron ABC transporter permease [Hellea balneolensis]